MCLTEKNRLVPMRAVSFMGNCGPSILSRSDRCFLRHSEMGLRGRLRPSTVHCSLTIDYRSRGALVQI
jgi:hypothetical protein